MSSYRQPDFLTPHDQPILRIRCPIHGFIHFSENERKIIDHPTFQRLRYIRQLALTELVYPGATHTRFEHSLGTMEVATRGFDTLAAKYGDKLESTFKSVEDFRKEPMGLARQVLRLAALLHDVGHVCFSHSAESVILPDKGHEKLTTYLLKEHELGNHIDRIFWPGCAQRVAQILEGVPNGPPQFQLLRDIVAGEMDADRTDYLLRDSLHCGVDYGRFDYRRMIECLELHEINEHSALEIALNFDGIHTFEALILARYQMNTQVYYHRLRRIYDKYLKEYCESIAKDAFDTNDKILAHNDMTIMARIMKDALHAKDDSKKWAMRIYNRDHHRVLFETGADADLRDIKRGMSINSVLQNKYQEREFLFDNAYGSIHKQYVRGDQNEEEYITLMVVGRNRRPQPIGEISQILGKIPKRFRCIRIYVNATLEEKGLLDEMRTFAYKEWRNQGGR